MSSELSIGDLADAAGVSRRTVRFYVQQRLLPAPLGRGRGRHYDASHLARLRRIAELQAAGHSLDAIRRILDGEGSDGSAESASAVPPPAAPRRAARVNLSAELWTRLRLGGGVELHYDAARHRPTVEQLMRLRDAVGDVFGPRPGEDNGSEENDSEEEENGSDGNDGNRVNDT
jgi:DNA-binding transcriptional MerR regulator